MGLPGGGASGAAALLFFAKKSKIFTRIIPWQASAMFQAILFGHVKLREETK